MVHSAHHLGTPSHDAVASALLAVGLIARGVAGVVVVGRRWPRAAIALLALVLGMSAYQMGIHSVHHLGEPEAAPACMAHAASQHLEGTWEETPALEPPPEGVRIGTPF